MHALVARAASLDGNAHTLVLSVEDRVQYLDGRYMSRRQAQPRWLDAYTVRLPYTHVSNTLCSFKSTVNISTYLVVHFIFGRI